MFKMKRLPNFKKQKIVELIKKGISINKISKQISIAKSTIYYYYKKIKGRKKQPLNLNPSYTKREGEIIGIFIGDGSECYEKKAGHYFVNVHFGLQNKRYLFYVKNLFESYFKKKFRIVQDKNRSIRITTYSKEICDYFKNYLDYDPRIKHSTVKLKTLNLPMEFKIGLIKGLVDTDGHVYFNEKEKKARVSFHTTSKVLALQVGYILDQLGIKYSCNVQKRYNWKPIYNVQLWKRSIENFLNEVKPYKTNKIRGL